VIKYQISEAKCIRVGFLTDSIPYSNDGSNYVWKHEGIQVSNLNQVFVYLQLHRFNSSSCTFHKRKSNYS
jgi:hypothetical protein